MYTVLIVDDCHTALAFYEELFMRNEIDVLKADNAEAGLRHLDENEGKVDAILSDIMMPDVDGYAFCRKVKEKPSHAEIPFIFASSLIDLDERVRGYEAGADDYIAKPVQAEEMVIKINNAIAIRNINGALNKQLKLSMSTAMQAMTYSSNLGLLLEFAKDGLSADSYQSLANNIFKFMGCLELNSVFQIHTESHTQTFSHRGVAAPIEENIFEMTRQQGRFIDFGARTIINYDAFSLLVKNMPKDDDDKYGMYKDVLGTLCDIIEQKINAFITKDAQSKKEMIIEKIGSTLNAVVASYEEMQKESLEALQEMTHELEMSFLSLDLLEHQEENLKKIIEQCAVKTSNSFDKGLKISEKFDVVRAAIGGLLN